jgi:transcriptional regulator with XRE-family HTH domain
MSAQTPAHAKDQLEPNKIVAANLRSLMFERSVNQVELATLSGVNQKTISNIVRGQHSCQIDVLWRIAGALGVPPWTLLVRGMHLQHDKAREITSVVTALLRQPREQDH